MPRNKGARSLARGSRIVAAMILLLLAAIFYGCSKSPAPVPDKARPKTEKKASPGGTVRVTLAAVGDIMMHKPQISAGYNPSSGDYDFSFFFREVKFYLSETDLTVGNLETTLSGEDRKFTGYPMFNSPDELATAIREAGFDVLTTANNHSLDRREYGLMRTIETLDRLGIKHTGTFSSPQDRETPLFVQVKGLKIAFISFTYGTNGMPVPKGKPYTINLMDTAKITRDVKDARAKGADFVVVMPHFGSEYQREPNEVQKKVVQDLLAAGADVILGSHPHVIQPVDVITRNEGGNEANRALVAYSLGNFVSAQSGLYKESGLILYFTLEKNLATGEVSVKAVKYRPTWVHRYKSGGKSVFRVVDVQDAMEEYRSGKDSRISSVDYGKLQKVWQATTGHLGREKRLDLVN